MQVTNLRGIRILLIAEQHYHANLFYEAWEQFEHFLYKSPMMNDDLASIFGVSKIKSTYVAAGEKTPLKDYFTTDVLKLYKDITITIIIGEFNQQDHFWINYLMHQQLLGDVLLFDPEVKESPMPIHVAHFCKDLQFDLNGMVKDLFDFFFHQKGVRYFDSVVKKDLDQRFVS